MRTTDKARQILQEIVEVFENKNLPEAIARTIIPSLPVPCSRWSLNNRLLAFFAQTADARGMRQWNQVGRHVLPGRTAFFILAPLLVKDREDEDGDAEGENSQSGRHLAGFRVVAVFRVEDTAGAPLDYPPLEPPQPPPLSEVARAWGVSVSYAALCGPEAPAFGSYSPSRKSIRLATHDEQVFFHELAHAAHEKVKGSLKGGQDWAQEVVAELTAATLMHLCDRAPDDGGAYHYIRRYAESAGHDAGKACMAVLRDVEACLELILTVADQAKAAA